MGFGQAPFHDTFDWTFTTQPAEPVSVTGWSLVHDSPNGLWSKVSWGNSPWTTFLASHVLTGQEVAQPFDDLILRVPANLTEGGHVSTRARYSYGAFRTRMRSAPSTGAAGVVNGFLYRRDDHGEIDVELLSAEQGGGTGVVHFKVHDLWNGQEVTQTVALPFDPTQGEHVYGFDWRVDRVDFVVDEVAIASIDSTQVNIPSQPGYIMLNNWTGNPNRGGGPPPLEVLLRVDWVSHTPLYFQADTDTVSAALPSLVTLTLDAGAANAGRPYLIAGSLTGSSPGVTAPGLWIPLNPDPFALTLAGVIVASSAPNVFQDFLGTLDPAGRATAILDVPGPLPLAAVGTSLHWAYFDLSPTTIASPAVRLVIDP